MGSYLTKRETDVIAYLLDKSRANERACDLIDLNFAEAAKELCLDRSNLSKLLKTLKSKGILESGFKFSMKALGTTCFSKMPL